MTLTWTRVLNNADHSGPCSQVPSHSWEDAEKDEIPVEKHAMMWSEFPSQLEVSLIPSGQQVGLSWGGGPEQEQELRTHGAWEEPGK